MEPDKASMMVPGEEEMEDDQVKPDNALMPVPEEEEREEDQVKPEKALMPVPEEEEMEEDQVDEQRKERMLIDVGSEKTNDKAPTTCLADPSADKVLDNEPQRKAIKLLVNHPRPSWTLSSAPDNGDESPKEPIKLKLKRSLSSPTVVVTRSSNDESQKSRELGQVGSWSVARSQSANPKKAKEWLSPGLLDESFESLSCEDSTDFGHKEMGPEPPGFDLNIDPLVQACLESYRNYHGNAKKNADPLIEACLESYQTYHENAENHDTYKKKDYNSGKRKRDLKWANEEEMVLALREEPDKQMRAICALYRQWRMLHDLGTTGLSDSHYKNLKRIAEFLTAGEIHGPCHRTIETLENNYKGCSTYCSWFLCTYSNELYQIYIGGADEHFC